MTPDSAVKPWVALKSIIDSGDAVGLQEFLENLESGELARSISRLDLKDQHRLLILLGPSGAADVIEDVSHAQAADLIEGLSPADAAEILDEVASDQKADVLGELDSDEAEAIIAEMSQEDADDTRRLIEYPDDSAGGIMFLEYLAYSQNMKIGSILADLKKNRERYADFSVLYIYLTGENNRLVGVLSFHGLLFASPDVLASTVMITAPKSVRADAPLSELREFFDDHKLLGAPVVDALGRLIGVVRPLALEQARTRRMTKQFLRISGIIGGEEFRSMSFPLRSGRRLSWLSINIVLNLIAAAVIAAYQDTLAAAITLAVFLPMISDMSGCSGNQAVAVSMRELTLGLIRPNELLRVLGKEASVGIVNGIVLGLLLGGLAYLWKGNPYLGLIVGAALAVNTVIAVSIGGMLPLIFRRLKLDPALVSGPALTTITDMCGFFLVLSMASAMLPKL